MDSHNSRWRLGSSGNSIREPIYLLCDLQANNLSKVITKMITVEPKPQPHMPLTSSWVIFNPGSRALIQTFMQKLNREK